MLSFPRPSCHRIINIKAFSITSFKGDLMKKLMSFILAFTLLFSLAACAAVENFSEDNPASPVDNNSAAEDSDTGKAENIPEKIAPPYDPGGGIVTGENPLYLHQLNFNGYMQKTEDFYIRDPFILLCDGVYFMYGSNIISPKIGNQGFSCYASLDLENWTGPFDLTAGKIDWSGYDYFWAPEVYFYNNEFYMFVSYRDKDTGAMGCSTLKADNPLGPFEMISDGFFTDEFFTPGQQWTIDASLYVDPDGQPWCFFTEHNVIHVAKFSDDLTELITEPVRLFDHTAVGWTVNEICEAPFIYTMKDTGTLVMLWAGFNHGGYFAATATASSPEGPWTVQNIPIYDATCSRKGEDGGHAMVFCTKEGQLTMALHAPNKIDYNAGIIEHAMFIPVEEDTETDCLKRVKALV